MLTAAGLRDDVAQRWYEAHCSHVYQRLLRLAARRWQGDRKVGHRSVTLLVAAVNGLWPAPWAWACVINGVIDCRDLSAIVRYDDTINAQSTIKLFQQIEAQNPQAARIHIICDNARYYPAQCVKDYLAHSKIELVFLPPYAPNLNLIERFWTFFKKTVLYGRYYETFCQFKTACDNFFAGLDQHHASLRSLLTDRFQIIGHG